MKTQVRSGFSLLVVLVLLVVCVVGVTPVQAWDKVSKDVEYTGKNVFSPQSTLDAQGTVFVSNKAAVVAVSNLTVMAGTVTLPSASLSASALPATISSSTLVSNSTLKVYGNNIVATNSVTTKDLSASGAFTLGSSATVGGTGTWKTNVYVSQINGTATQFITLVFQPINVNGGTVTNWVLRE